MGAMELSPGVHKVEGVRGANVYLVTTEEGTAIIDTGLPGNEKKLLGYAAKVGVQPAQISLIVLTHADIDHSGSAAKLKASTGAKLAVHAADAPRVAGEMKLKEVKGGMGLLMGVVSPFMRFTPVKPDLLLKESDTVLGLSVVHTPGHTDGSISLYKEGAVLFVGDALRTDSEGKPMLPPAGFTADMDLAKESIRKVSALSYGLLLPGHGAPGRGGSASLAAFVASGFR